jgi:hypothetical protein
MLIEPFVVRIIYMPDCSTLLHISYLGLTYVHIHNAIYLTDAAGVAVLQKLLLEDSVFAEVLAEVLEDAVTILFQIEFVSPDAKGAIVDGK